MTSATKPETVNPARETPLGVREAVDEIETVGQLLEVAKMACGDLPSDAIGPLRTLLSVIKMICATGPGLERDVRELIEAASMACVALQPREGGALRSTAPERRTFIMTAAAITPGMATAANTQCQLGSTLSNATAMTGPKASPTSMAAIC